MAGEKVGGNAQGAFNQTVFTTQTLTTTTAGSKIVGLEGYTTALFFAQVSSVTGTTPTFDICVQRLMPDNTTWQAILNFPQFTTAANKYYHYVTGSSATATTATSLTAGTNANLAMGGTIRVNVVVGGTNPSGIVLVTADFLA